MYRTTIILPEHFQTRLKKEAQQKNLSFGELIRNVLEKYILTQDKPEQFDPFLSSTTVFDDDKTDVAKNHDRYLYNDPEKRSS